ncbi:hypothetical protein EVG20_g6571 [Dentipellis fragilis]|uniref:SAM-dependent MTase RsmB/NOP-type domain-containing protein n=1 Tax=Dentipellis fragilis TaxID=205917 RepID=A0A4Y9YJQ3_9AGAM|nr:hypothetical protein EVG20_g6571 [Dentipellis fragilis]
MHPPPAPLSPTPSTSPSDNDDDNDVTLCTDCSPASTSTAAARTSPSSLDTLAQNENRYPEGLAWQFNVPKKVLRKSPEFKKFHSFLVFETEVGNVSRQEAVSMLPPLFLDVLPHHKVLDMCAAPGSKTAQLLEALHLADEPTTSSIPPGLLIANDSDYKRTHLLIHQSARLPSPALMVTNVDASIFPVLRLPAGQGSKMEPLLFDRILCDVPCSGDGTIRKNVGIWKYWNPMDGNGLHGLQLRILQRAMRMLHSDGRLVYSTCSLNPVENEAVIAEALRTIPGFELVDVSTSLPTLQRCPGMTAWVPTTDRNLMFHDTYEAYIASIPEAKRKEAKMGKSHWPPPAEEVKGLHLDRCMRIYPHLQDTGGFFVAVLQRKSAGKAASASPSSAVKRTADELPDVEESEAKKAKLEADVVASKDEPMDQDTPAETPTEATPAPEAAPKGDGNVKGKGKERQDGDSRFKENPYTYIPSDDVIVQSCVRQLSLKPTFPAANVLVRNPSGEPSRSLYLTNDLVHAVLDANDFKKMRLMTAGTKIFTKQDSGFGRANKNAAAAKEGEEKVEKEAVESQWRLLSEGLPVVLPYVEPASIIEAELASGALRTLVEGYYPLTSTFAEVFRVLVEVKSLGSHVVRFKTGTGDGASLTHDLVLPIWKSQHSVSLMIDKKAKSAMSLRVFGEDLTVAGREAAAKQKKPTASGVSAANTPAVASGASGAAIPAAASGASAVSTPAPVAVAGEAGA